MLSLDIDVPVPILDVMTKLYNSGADVYIVGGAIRDTLMGYPVKDWDLATNAQSEKIKELFPDVDMVGASFGVFLIREQGMEIELARFRTEGAYSDNRHPDNVDFVSSIQEDILRRDFTVNAIAVDIYKKVVYVPHAIEDTKRGIVRAVGNPEKRFEEDPLRILRAFRLMSEKGLTLEPITAGACLRKASLLNTLSGERIFQEFYRILNGKFVVKTLRKMRDLRVLEVLVPEILPCYYCGQYSKYHDLDVFEHILATLPNLTGDDRVAGFFHDIGKPVSMFFDPDGTPHFYGKAGVSDRHEITSARIAYDTLKRWHCPNELINRTVKLIESHMADFLRQPTPKKARKFYASHGALSYSQVALYFADREARKNPDTRNNKKKNALLIQLLDGAVNTCGAFKVTDLAINGDDVMSILGVGPSAVIGKVLNRCLNKVLDNPSRNTREWLVKYVQRQEKKI